MENKKISVCYEWSFGSIGGKELRFFSSRKEAECFAKSVTDQLTFEGVERCSIRIGAKGVCHD